MSRTYETAQGDMWDAIAFTQLGDVIYTDRLINLNQQYVGYYIFPSGVMLTLPELSPEVSATAPPWKQVAG